MFGTELYHLIFRNDFMGPNNQKEITTSRHEVRSRQRIAGALFLTGGISFWIIVTIAEAIYPSYSVRTNMLSDLGAIGTTTGLFFDISVFSLSLLWVVAAFLIFSQHKRYLIANLLLPVGLLLASASPENVYLPVHITGAYIGFVGGAAATLYDFKTIKSPFRYFALILGTLSAVSIVVLFRGYTNGIDGQTLGAGGWERLVLYPLVAWFIVLGAYLMSDGRLLLSDSASK
jgi:hypothetical membrane protein